MSRPKLSLPTRYGAAVATVALAVAINLLLADLQHPSAIFLAAVAVSAWYLGLGPGLVATALSAIALDYFFRPDTYPLDFGPATWVWLATYVGTAVLINGIHETQRRFILVLRDNDRQKSEFMTELAHELRNFISPTANALATLEACGAGDRVAEQACATAQRQIDNMTHLINDLLEAARINQGKVRLSLERADLGAIITRAVESARPLIDARGHRLALSLPSGPAPVEADTLRLEEVFLNLLTNAAKYTEPGGRIWLTLEPRNRQWLVRVRDSGKGLTREALLHVFDLYVQADSGSQGGLGIGLNLVRGLVELHGGSVEAISAGAGRGSEFIVYLPAAVDHDSKPNLRSRTQHAASRLPTNQEVE